MNAIALLKSDHRAVEELFDKIEQLGAKARGKKPLVEKLIRELSIHAAIEEQIFYPAVKEGVSGAEEKVLESLEEHGVVKWTCHALQSMEPGDERYDAKLKVLKDVVLHHVEEEEGEMFPRARDAMSVAQLNELGNRLERAKKTAPTHPHPRAPDQPPGNVVAGLGAALVDRARDAGRAALRGRQRSAGRSTGRSTGRGAAQGAGRTTTPRTRRTTQATRRSTPAGGGRTRASRRGASAR